MPVARGAGTVSWLLPAEWHQGPKELSQVSKETLSARAGARVPKPGNPCHQATLRAGLEAP
ncbi:unnamed protein product [Rangifer tarandus platyrhynchus]|uniref:Uncharacterized protein n=1 Tax=Rangifer tarandus platyrhynchus TaxID=3082113 RepID=A0AC59ZGZ5_RANTA